MSRLTDQLNTVKPHYNDSILVDKLSKGSNSMLSEMGLYKINKKLPVLFD